MAEPMSIPSLKSIFRFPFQGQGWEKRFLMGVLLTFLNFVIPFIPAVFVSGYMLEVMRRAVKGEDLILPDWADWGKLGRDGLKYYLVSLVFLLPGSLIYLVGFGLYFIVTLGFSITANLSQNPNDLGAAFVPVFLIAMLVFFVSMVLGPVLFFLGAIPLPAAIANMAVEGRLAAGFRLHQWWPVLWKNKLGYFIVWTILFGLFYMLSMVYFLVYITCILCWLIPFLLAPMGFYLSLVYSALFGVTFRESLESQQPEQAVVPEEPGQPSQPEAPSVTDEVPQV